jgi:hypothetical protein
MSRKKYTNDVLAGNNNGGLHSRRKLNTVEQLFTTHDLKKPVLYQFILSGSDKAEYQATMKAIMRHIRTKCRAEYIGAYEFGAEKGGIHEHAFVIIETSEHFPSDLLDVSEGKFIARRIARKAKAAKAANADKSLSIRIEPPKNRMHGGAMCAKMDTPAKLANCIEWCSYALKTRSKEGVPGREKYTGSEFVSNIAKREAQRQKHRDALLKSSRPAPAPASIPAPTPAPKEPTMTPAEKFIASKYEAAVDQGLDVEALRLFLLAHGIRRTPAQVTHDLDNVYGFYQYASSHPAPPPLDVAEFDRKAWRKDVGSVQMLAVSTRTTGDRNGTKALDDVVDCERVSPDELRLITEAGSIARHLSQERNHCEVKSRLSG